MSKCNQCGECCKFLTFTIPGIKTDRIYREYYKAHGCTIVGDRINVPMRCPHLTEDNKCDMHETKPFLCKVYKGQSGDGKFSVPKGCGYNE